MARGGYKKVSNGDDKEKVGVLSQLLFQWMNVVFRTGSEQTLQESDFLPLSKENSAWSLTEKLQTNWNKEIARCTANGKRSKLWKSVIKMLSAKEAMIIIFTSALETLCQFPQPLLLGYLVSTLMSAEPQRNPLLYGCALAMGLNALIGCLANHQLEYRCEMLGIRISSALKGLVYHKVSTDLKAKS